jgi:LacI family transcriptional regulator
MAELAPATVVRPRLTTVSNRPREHGQVGARMLLRRLMGEYTGPSRIELIPTDLVIRKSTPEPR